MWTALGYALCVLVALYGLLLWFSPSRTRAMAAVASELGLQFEPTMSRERMGVRGTAFDTATLARNCMRGMIAGRETVIFDQRMWTVRDNPGEGLSEQTVVGFRVAADSCCRNRGILQPSKWNVEKMGEWVFVYGAYGLSSPVKPGKIAAYVEEARSWFEKATDPNWYEPTILAGRMG